VLQRAAQLALHCPVQVVVSPDEPQAPEQLPWHVALQSVLQSYVPGFTVHLAEQPPWQLAWQLGSMAVHPPEQLASSCASHATCTLGAEQARSHDPVTSALHVSFPLKTAPPQSEKMSARADPAANKTVTPASTATKPRSEEERFTRDLHEKALTTETGAVIKP
jgi:hypothetical protein